MPDGGDEDAGTDAGMDAGPSDAGMDAPMDAGPMCADDGVDDDWMMATDLGDITDSAGYPYDNIDGDIFPIDDVDWYSFHIEDELLADIDPRVALAGRPVDVPWQLCVYYDCDSDTNSVECPDGTTVDNVDGLAGCCITSTDASRFINPTVSCSGIDDSGTVYARVSREGETAFCDGYTLTWGDA